MFDPQDGGPRRDQVEGASMRFDLFAVFVLLWVALAGVCTTVGTFSLLFENFDPDLLAYLIIGALLAVAAITWLWRRPVGRGRKQAAIGGILTITALVMSVYWTFYLVVALISRLSPLRIALINGEVFAVVGFLIIGAGISVLALFGRRLRVIGRLAGDRDDEGPQIMSDPTSGASRGKIGRLIGLIFIVIGVLWLVLTGLCSAVFALDLLGQGNLDDISIVLTIAVPSALIGGVIYAIGRWLRPSK